jgi:hypothetical protein
MWLISSRSIQILLRILSLLSCYNVLKSKGHIIDFVLKKLTSVWKNDKQDSDRISIVDKEILQHS